MKRKNHFDPSLPVSASNLPDEAIKAMQNSGVYASEDAILKETVGLNPVTGILQPVQNIISPVTPDLTNTNILLGNTDKVPAGQLTANDLPAGLSIYDLPAEGQAALKANEIAKQTDVNVQAEKIADLSVQLNDPSISVDKANEIVKQIIDASALTSQAAENPVMSKSDATVAVAINLLNSQALVVLAAKNEDAATNDLNNAKTDEDKAKATEALKQAQDTSNRAADDLIAYNAQDAEAAQKAKDLLAIANAKIIKPSVTVKTNLFDRLVNYIYEKLYKK